jgi:hypothetical protein
VRYSSTVLALAACSALVLAAPAVRAQNAAPQGTVVVTRSAPDALLLWDASSAVTALQTAKTAPAAGIASLEAEAMRIAVLHAPDVPNAKTVTVQIFYANTTYVNPTYPTAVYAGTVRLLSLTSSLADIVRSGGRLAETLERGTIPPEVSVVVQGALPVPAPAPSP